MIPESSEVSRTHTALPEVGQLVEVEEDSGSSLTFNRP